MVAPTEAQTPPAFIAEDPVTCALLGDLRKIAAHSDVNMGLIGPRGSGKTTLAHLLHCCSPRRDKPFRSLNVAALTPTLAEAELFGTVRGAFNDATNKAGLLELAGEGTLFLDELAEAEEALQLKMLYVIETGRYTRVGEPGRERRVNCRIATATHSPDKLRDDIRDRFPIWLEIPPLNQRRGDIAPLATHFLSLHKPGWRWSEAGLDWLGDAAWPGDARGLGNFVQQLVLLADEATQARKMIDIDLILRHAGPRPRATASVRGVSAPDVVAAELSAEHPEGWTRKQFEDRWREEASSRTARRRLASLVSDGVVVRTGSSKLIRYHVAGQIAGQLPDSVQECPDILSGKGGGEGLQP